MCIKIDLELIKGFTISYFAGLVASLAIIFSLQQQQKIYDLIFMFWIVILYLIGLICCGIINYGINRKNRKNSR